MTARTRSDIDALLERPDGVRAVFQPVIDLRTGVISGYEALARFDLEEPLSVEEGFAAAHRFGLGHALEARAIRMALAGGRPPGGGSLGINVSPSALFSLEVDSVLPPRLDGILIEVTEHELVAGGARLIARLGDLRARGARLAIDDAGAGYAGFGQLMRLMPDVIKLDRDLVSGIDTNVAKAALADAFVTFARRIDAAVCAEGIEREAELRVLADLDVTYGQGFFLARPAPPWAAVSPPAARACREGFRDALGIFGPEPVPGEPRAVIERLAARLARCSGPEDVAGSLSEIGSALGVRSIYLSRLVGDGLSQRLVTWATDDPDNRGESYNVAAFPETARLLRTGEAAQVMLDDDAADPAELDVLRAMDCSSVLIVPLFARDGPIGLLEAFSDEEAPFSRQRIGIARTIAHQLAIMLQADQDRWASATGEQRSAAPAPAARRPGLAADG